MSWKDRLFGGKGNKRAIAQPIPEETIEEYTNRMILLLGLPHYREGRVRKHNPLFIEILQTLAFEVAKINNPDVRPNNPWLTMDISDEEVMGVIRKGVRKYIEQPGIIEDWGNLSQGYSEEFPYRVKNLILGEVEEAAKEIANTHNKSHGR